MVVVYVFAGVVSLVGVTVWIGLLIWAAKGDGEVQGNTSGTRMTGIRPIVETRAGTPPQ